ncbi:MAG: site-specific integrase [Thermoanaerobaculia bacterium]|nr:site-specific integrase [Thermoanaerobaculia bacterium]
MKVRLNKTVIDEAVYEGPGGCYVWDERLTGFGVRIYPSGTKSFVVTYWAKGRQRFFTIGRYGKITLHQAKADALELFLKVHCGEDPAGDRQAARRAPTVADLADRHVREHSEINKKPRNAKRDRTAWDRLVLPKLGRRKVKDVTRADIAKLMTGLADTPAMANKVLTLLSKAFNLAEIWDWRSEGTNPCRHVGRYQEDSRERFLSQSELTRLGQVLGEAETAWGTSTHAIAAIRLLILTGCRSSEILKLCWDDVDYERRCLHLPDGKTGKRQVVLNTHALQILADLEHLPDNPHVIPGNKPGSHRATLQNTWNRIRREADIGDVRIHDLRHTYASYGVNGGQSLAMIGKLLGHRKVQTTMRYTHLADDPLRQAAESIGAELTAGLEGKKPGDLVALSDQRKAS